MFLNSFPHSTYRNLTYLKPVPLNLESHIGVSSQSHTAWIGASCIATQPIDITSDQMYHLKKRKRKKRIMQPVFFRKSRHEHMKPPLQKLHWLPVKERIFLKIVTLIFVHFTVPCHHSCHPVSLRTLHLVLSVSVLMKKNSFLCTMETQGLWPQVVLCSGTPCLTQPSSQHPIQQLVS